MRQLSVRQRGLTLLEVMMTMGVVLLGMMVLFRTMSSQSRGAVTTNHITQATMRAQQVMESLNNSSRNVLTCLSTNTSDYWAPCEVNCQAELTGLTLSASATLTAPQACVFTTLSTLRLDHDNNQQQYAVVYDAADPTRSTWVVVPVTSTKRFDVQVTIGWNDDNTPPPYQHRVTVGSSIYRD